MRSNVDGLRESLSLDAALPKSSCTVIDIPIAVVIPYLECRAETEVIIAGRAPLCESVNVSYNPCPKTVKAGGDATAFQAAAGFDLAACGKCSIAWDEENFYLAATVPKAAVLQFAVAPDYTGPWATRGQLRDWHEFQVTPEGKLSATLGPATGTRLATRTKRRRRCL